MASLGEIAAGARTCTPLCTLGGGSPTLLEPDDSKILLGKKMRCMHILTLLKDAEISIEIDPSDVTPEKIEGMVAISA